MPVRRRTGEDGTNSDHGSQRGSPRSRSPDGRTPLKAPGGPDEEAAKAAAEPSPEMPQWAHDWAEELAGAEGADPSWACEWAEELNKLTPPAPDLPPAPPPKAQAAGPPPESPFKFGTATPAPAAPHLAQAQAEHAANQPWVKPHEVVVAPAPATPTAQDLAGSLLMKGRQAIERSRGQGTPQAPTEPKGEVDPDGEIMRIRPEDVPDPNYVVDLEA